MEIGTSQGRAAKPTGAQVRLQCASDAVKLRGLVLTLLGSVFSPVLSYYVPTFPL